MAGTRVTSLGMERVAPFARLSAVVACLAHILYFVLAKNWPAFREGHSEARYAIDLVIYTWATAVIGAVVPWLFGAGGVWERLWRTLRASAILTGLLIVSTAVAFLLTSG